MLGKALIQAASIGCDMRVGEGGGSIFVWRALQRRYRVIRKDKSRACIQENGSPVWNPRFTRHAHSRCGKAFVQPLRELPKGTFRFGPRGEKRGIRRAGQVFPYEPAFRAGQTRGEQAMMCGNKRIHAFLCRNKAIARGVANLPFSYEHFEAFCIYVRPCRLPVHAGSHRLP